MRVLYVHGKGELAGGDFSLLTLLRNVDRDRFKPYVIVAKKGPVFPEYEKFSEKAQQIAFTVIKSPDNFIEFLKMIFGFFPSVIRIFSIINKWKIDLVHVNSIVTPSAVIAAKLAGKPCIVHKREIIVAHKLFGLALDIITSFFATKMIAVSEETKKFSIKSLQNKTVVIHNGVDISDISTQKGSSSLDYLHKLQKFTKLIGMFSRIEPWKGQEVAVDALKYVVRRFKNVKLFIFGKPYTTKGKKYFNLLKKRVVENNLETFIAFPGVEKSLKKIYAEFDIILLPSIDPEPFSRVIIESMAAGVPTIATNIGGNKESVVDGKTGLLVEPKKPEKLAGGILKLLNDETLRRRMRKNSIERARNKFDMKKMIENVEKLYVALVRQ